MKAFRPQRKPARRRPCQAPRFARLGIELLEERLAPSSSPLAIPLAVDPGAGLVAANTAQLDSTDEDFGDAPTAAQSGFAANYPTTIADSGARHTATGPTLGANRRPMPMATTPPAPPMKTA